MKIADVKIVFTEHGIQLCRVNKRGNPQAGGVDVTREVLDQLMDLLKSEEGKVIKYERLDGDIYEISVKKLTEEQKEDRAEKKKLDSENGLANTVRLLSMFGAFNVGMNPFAPAKALFIPPQPKITEKGFFECMKEHCRHTRSFTTPAGFSEWVSEQFDHGYNIALIEGAYRVAAEMDYAERQSMNDWDWLEWFAKNFRITFGGVDVK